MTPVQVLQIFDANGLFEGLHDRLPTSSLAELCSELLKVLGYMLPLKWSDDFIYFTLRLWHNLWYVQSSLPSICVADFTLRDSEAFSEVSAADLQSICNGLVELLRYGRYSLTH